MVPCPKDRRGGSVIANLVIYLTGIYALGAGFALMLAPGRMSSMIDSIADVPAVSYVTGAILAPTGAAVLIACHGFATLEVGIATVIGAGMLLEGWLLMAAPKTLLSIARPFLMAPPQMRIMGAVVVLLGAVLTWLGWPY